ncbi:hypothetical protein ACFL0L_02980 [Patescibacteria group bacterium]
MANILVVDARDLCYRETLIDQLRQLRHIPINVQSLTEAIEYLSFGRHPIDAIIAHTDGGSTTCGLMLGALIQGAREPLVGFLEKPTWVQLHDDQVRAIAQAEPGCIMCESLWEAIGKAALMVKAKPIIVMTPEPVAMDCALNMGLTGLMMPFNSEGLQVAIEKALLPHFAGM